MTIESIFADFSKRCEAESLAVRGVAIADGERVLMETHMHDDKPYDIYSHTKSYMVSGIGMAIADGKLSLDTRFSDLFPEYIPENADERLTKFTLRNLLTMSSGFGAPYLMRWDRRCGVGNPDYIAYMMSRPMKYEPGERFDYSTADSILAGRMLERATGQMMGKYLYERLFRQMDQGWPIWETDPDGHACGGAGIHMKLTDMMKLGQLYLNGGSYHGKQLLDPAWVKECTKAQIEIDQEEGNPWRCAYGYQFWTSPYPDSYRADGAYGQITTVLPKSGLVVGIQCPESGNFDQVRNAMHEGLLGPISEL